MAVNFVADPTFIRKVASGRQMRVFLEQVVQAAVPEVESRKTKMRGRMEPRVRGFTQRAEDGTWQGVVESKGPFWHFYEYGTQNNAARPYLRTGVALALRAYGGGFIATPKASA
jgi:hypothetical protein